MELKLLNKTELDAITVGGTCIVGHGYPHATRDWIHEEFFLATVSDKRMGEGGYDGFVKVKLTGRFIIEFRVANPPVLNLMTDLLSSPFGITGADSSTRVYQDTPSTRELLRDLLLIEVRRQQATKRAIVIEQLHASTFAEVLSGGLIGPLVKEAIESALAKQK